MKKNEKYILYGALALIVIAIVLTYLKREKTKLFESIGEDNFEPGRFNLPIIKNGTKVYAGGDISAERVTISVENGKRYVRVIYPTSFKGNEYLGVVVSRGYNDNAPVYYVKQKGIFTDKFYRVSESFIK